MKRDQILDAFRHCPLTPESIELQKEIAETMTGAVASIAAKLPDCPERSAFISLSLQAQAIANGAAARNQVGKTAAAAPGADSPALPRDDLDDGSGTAAPDSGIVRLGLDGPFHRATPGRPSFESRLDTPPGAYKRAIFRFRLRHGGWHAVPSRNHNLFWFARDRHVDLFGFGVAKGPGGPPQVFYRTDWGVKHTNKQRVVERYLMQPGETYDVRFDFDAGGGRIVLRMADSSGAEVLRAKGKPNISEIHFAPGHKIAVGFGFRGEHDNEPAQPGWVWSDLKIELEPANG